MPSFITVSLRTLHKPEISEGYPKIKRRSTCDIFMSGAALVYFKIVNLN